MSKQFVFTFYYFGGATVRLWNLSYGGKLRLSPYIEKSIQDFINGLCAVEVYRVSLYTTRLVLRQNITQRPFSSWPVTRGLGQL